MKKAIGILLAIMMIFSSGISVYAEETIIADELELVIGEMVEECEDEEMEDIPCPYTLYIMGVDTTIIDKGDGRIYMGVEVYCTHVMAEIVTIFYFQQATPEGWLTLCSAKASITDDDSFVKFAYVNNPPSGNYRVKTSNMVTDYNGYSEAITGYSGDIHYFA